jgi:sulfur-carrier protein
MKVRFFGRLAEITSVSVMEMETLKDTDTLLAGLNATFPGLVKNTFVICVNGQAVKGNVKLERDNEVALLPPFSGG